MRLEWARSQLCEATLQKWAVVFVDRHDFLCIFASNTNIYYSSTVFRIMKCCVDFSEYLNESSNSSARLVDFEVRTIEESLRTDVGTGNGAAYKIKQLFNKHGYNLSIMPGHVRGKEQNM